MGSIYILTNRIIRKVRKKKKQHQNLEFGHSRWGETQKTINFGAKDRKPSILVIN
jgi:hypothetical protein